MLLPLAGGSSAVVNLGERAKCLHGVAFLRWIRHPEPTGSRRATPLLYFNIDRGKPYVGNHKPSDEEWLEFYAIVALPPIVLFLAGLGLVRIWERFGEAHWLRLPEHLRR